jgi:Protein of unknown function (DUF3486)
MPKASNIRRLPPEIRELIGKLRDQGSTIDEIKTKLGELNVKVSRSALGRWTKHFDSVAENIQRSRTVAEAIVSKLGDKPASRVARLNIELMHSVIMKLLVSEDGKQASFDAQEAMFLSQGLQRLAQAAKQDAEMEVKIRDAVKAEMADKAKAAATAATGEMKRGGLSAETIKRIETEILGIAR